MEVFDHDRLGGLDVSIGITDILVEEAALDEGRGVLQSLREIGRVPRDALVGYAHHRHEEHEAWVSLAEERIGNCLDGAIADVKVGCVRNDCRPPDDECPPESGTINRAMSLSRMHRTLGCDLDESSRGRRG